MHSNGFEMHSNANRWLRSAFEWDTAIRTDFCAGRRVEAHFQGAGARTWLLERRTVPARGIRNRLAADGRFSSKQILCEVQWRLGILLSASEYSAYHPVCGPNPADLRVCGRDVENSLLAQTTSPSRMFAQQWKLPAMAQGAALKEVANGEQRR